VTNILIQDLGTFLIGLSEEDKIAYRSQCKVDIKEPTSKKELADLCRV
jgi:hypothetical protein